MVMLHEQLSPLVAPDAWCATCAKKMKVTVEKNKAGHALKVVYSCDNKDTGCSYFVESDQRLNGMQQPIKDAR